MVESLGVDLIRQFRLQQTAQIKSTDPEVGSHLRYEVIEIAAVPVSSNKTTSLSWNYPIDICHGALYSVTNDADDTDALEQNDKVSVWANVGVIGTVQAVAAINDTVLTVDATVGQNVNVGDYIKIAALADEYEVKSVDSDTQITLVTGLITAAAINDVVTMLRYFVGTSTKPLILSPFRKDGITFGDVTLDSTRLPTGKTLNIKFENSSATIVKDVVGEVAILY